MMMIFHVRLADRTHARPTIDLTPDKPLSYRQARALLLKFGHLFPSLHEAGCPSYLEIQPMPDEAEQELADASPYVSASVDRLWQMHGRICDLPGYMLDGLAVTPEALEHRPEHLIAAQKQLDARRDAGRRLRSDA